MARYFLHIANNSSITVDETGLELPDDESAISQGSRAAGQMLADELADWCEDIQLKIYVETDEKRHVATISVSGSLSR